MQCPICGNHETKVIDSRKGINEVRRRRECMECLTRFSTSEVVIFESINKYIRERMKLHEIR